MTRAAWLRRSTFTAARGHGAMALALAGLVVLAALATLSNPAHADDTLVEAPFATAAEPRRTDTVAPRTVVAITGLVLRVQDGDSFTLRADDGREHGVRIAGIDAPERTQPYADVSRRALRAQIDRRTVRVDMVKTDFYGRVVGNVYIDGHDVGLSQLQAGLAWHFVRYDADLEPAERRRYAEAESAAKLRGTGLWEESAPVAPWLFRTQRR